MQTLLLSQLDELKTACVSPDALTAAADGCSGNLSDKLRDLALIAEAYDAVVSNGRADPSDRLTRLAEAIPESDFGPETYIYIDGFTDFTAQERRVIAELLKKGAEVTVCLTCGDGDSEVYAVPRAAMNCEYFDACHFSDGDGDDHIRYITKMKPAQVWDRLKGGDGNV